MIEMGAVAPSMLIAPHVAEESRVSAPPSEALPQVAISALVGAVPQAELRLKLVPLESLVRIAACIVDISAIVVTMFRSW